MAKAIWNGQVLAESDRCRTVEGTLYFPPESVRTELIRPAGTTYTCGWKGVCDYYHVSVDGKENPEAAWCYADPLPAAENVRGMFAFWKGVEVQA